MNAADVVVYGTEAQYAEVDDGLPDDGTAGNRRLLARALKKVKKLIGYKVLFYVSAAAAAKSTVINAGAGASTGALASAVGAAVSGASSAISKSLASSAAVASALNVSPSVLATTSLAVDEPKFFTAASPSAAPAAAGAAAAAASAASCGPSCLAGIVVGVVVAAALLAFGLNYMVKVLKALGPKDAVKLASDKAAAAAEDIKLNMEATAKATPAPARSARSVLLDDVEQLNIRQVQAVDALDAISFRLPALHLTPFTADFGGSGRGTGEPVPHAVP